MKLDEISGSIPDDRDYIYVTQPGPYKPKLDLKPDVFEIEDQLSIGSCTCNSSISALEMLKPASYSRLFAYWQTRNVVEDRPGQEGASLRDAIRSHYHYGVPLESVWPYDEAQVNNQPPLDAYTDAITHKVTRYEAIPVGTSFEAQDAARKAIKSALNEGLPVVIASHVGVQIQHLTGPWQSHTMMPTAFGPIINQNTWIGNHATLIIGYDDAVGKWLVQNSWGNGYGDGGFFGYDYWALDCDLMEAWVIRGFCDVMINPIPTIPYVTPPATVLGWYKSVWRTDVTDPMDPNVQYWAHDAGGEKNFLTSYKAVVDQIITDRLAQL